MFPTGLSLKTKLQSPLLRLIIFMSVINSRYGYSQRVDDPNDEWITAKLILELRSEQFDEPDDEHTQVSVSNEHWSVTAQVSGLITFDNLDLLEGDPSDLPETMHLRNIPDSELIAIWQAVVRSDQASLLAHEWQSFDQIAAYESDYYRSE